MRPPTPRALEFALERWIQRGILQQFLLMAGLIAAISLVGGLAAFAVSEDFATPREAVWWAFLRLTDPGYLGDDQGLWLRTVSTVVTVLGYVVFMGSLIAILTQWLARTIRRLESGLTPISMRGHVVILGWTNRTLEIVVKLIEARGRLERFLARRFARRLRVVIQCAELGPERRVELRASLGRRWREGQILLRTGSSLRPEDLERLDVGRAAVVVVPAAEFELGGAELSDARVVKTLLGLESLLARRPPEQRPQLVAEVFDPAKAAVASAAVRGGVHVVSSDHVISRLISQSIRHPGLARILFGLLSHRQGNSLYVRVFDELAGRDLPDVRRAFPTAVLLGCLRRTGERWHAHLGPGAELRVERGDLLVLLAEAYERCVPATGVLSAPPVRAIAPLTPSGTATLDRRVLILGWSHKVPVLVREMEEADAKSCEVTVLSRVPAAQREEELARVRSHRAGVPIVHVEGDRAFAADLARVKPERFDSVIFLASRLVSSSEEADARTLLGYLMLTAHLRQHGAEPEVLVELLDPDNLHLFAETEDTVLVSPRVLSHLLAHVALRPELALVFDEIFGAGGAEIDLVLAAGLGLAGPTTFAELQEVALSAGLVALGLVLADRSIHLNPERSRTFALATGDQVVVLRS